MSIALRTWLIVSAAAGATACASNPPLQPVDIDYRGYAPGEGQVHAPPRAVVMSDAAGALAPQALIPAPQMPPVLPPAADATAPYQIVADLGPSTGVAAVEEARGLTPQAGKRPGGARRLPADDPAARAIRVQPQDTLYDISRRYSVNMRALIETNSLAPPFALEPGRVIYLPAPNVHVVDKGETLYSISRRYNVDTRSLALLNGMSRPWTVWPGDEMLLPPLAREQAREPAKPVLAAPVQASVQPKPAPPKPQPPKAGPDGPISLAGTPLPVLPKATPTPAPPPQPSALPPPPSPPPPPKSTPAPSGSSEFIWPVSGKVLKGYGPSADGMRNDGVNISAPKGAQVLAAAGGEVVYAGSELAGFGNLVLIRHPGGWVTAYAHADSVLVREGDLVKQGQAVATVGSTGNAASPQVHFELRKGKEPVDPTGRLPALNG